MKDEPKSIDELYSDYKLFYAKCFMDIAKNKKELFEAIKELSMYDLSKREDIIKTFKRKVSELNISEEELFCMN